MPQHKNPQKVEESSAMKAYQASATSSSLKSSTIMEDRDSCYYPGCRKDANCNCEICIASINATLDLMPVSIQKSSLTKLSTSRPSVERTPLSFDFSVISTPKSTLCPKMESPVLKSTARLNLNEKKEKKKRERRATCCGSAFCKLIFGLNLFFAIEMGFSWAVCGVLKPVFSADSVRSIGQRSWVVLDLSRKLRFLQNELKGFAADGKVSNCSDMDSVWEINQDGQLLISRCVLYRSAMEEASVWGWPLQTAGLLKTGFASRSFTVLSGRVTEWPDGKIGYSIKNANTSWVQSRWTTSVVQLDPNTWILEYGRSSVLDNSRLVPTITELFKYQMSRAMKKMNHVFSLLSVFEEQYNGITVKTHIKIPT